MINNKNGGNDINMTAQVQQPQQQMQSLQQPFRPLSQMPEWQQQPQGQLPTPTNSLPSSPKPNLVEANPKPPSPTNLSVTSSSTKSSKSSKTKSSRSSSKLISNTATTSHHQVKRGSGVDIKGPTPEVAQQLRFPWKLHLLLERSEYEHQQRLAAAAAEGKNPASIPDMPISWLPCGKAFKVHDKERFVQEIMPSFFGTQSFKTFQRNLNLWGFTRVSKGPQKDVCSHPLFLKGFPAVCQSMKRIVLKGTGRGNRAPLGGVDVSSVQAVVAAAAMQQAQQQQAQQQASGIVNGGLGQIPHHIQAQQVLQQQQLQVNANGDVSGFPQQNALNLSHPNQQQNLQQHQFVVENGSIHAAPVPSQKLVVLPSPAGNLNSATTTVLWPNNLNQSLQQQQLQQNSTNTNSNLQKNLQQLSSIIQQLSNNSVNNNTANLQQQQLQVTPTPLLNTIQQQQQPAMMPQQQQSLNPNAVVTSSPMSTQDLVTLLLQRNLQQQACQVQSSQSPQQSQIQLQVPTSLFPSGSLLSPQPATSLQPQPQSIISNGNNAFAAATSPTNFLQQQQGSTMGNNIANILQQGQQGQTMATTSASAPDQQQQQNQLLQLLLQQNGWTTSL